MAIEGDGHEQYQGCAATTLVLVPLAALKVGGPMPSERRHESDLASEPLWVQWRVKRLLGLGFSAELADRLAHDGRVDIHALLQLVDGGCQPDVAARIVAPLDCDPPPP